MHVSARRLYSIAFFIITVVSVLTRCASAADPITESARVTAGYIRGDRATPADTVIVFVHGVLGGPASTWTNAKTGAYFPYLVRDDPTFEGADIWVHSYPSPKFTASYTLDELADHLRRHLNNDNVVSNHRSVIFVSHSMGGLVVRAYLLKYREDISPARVPMLYFFSTPTTGAEIANYVRIFSHNPQLFDLREIRTGQSSTLATYDAQWSSSPYPQQTRSYCAYETLKTIGIQIVQRSSAEHLCNSRLDPIRANHIDISKPSGADDESYIAFRDAYRNTMGRPSDLLTPRMPLWNVRPGAPSLVLLSATGSSPACYSCWSPELQLPAGGRIYARIHYQNDGELAAHNVRLRLAVPSDIMSDSIVLAALSNDGANGLQSAACVATSGAPFVMVPINAWWYPNSTEHPLPLPYGQSALAITSHNGLEIGDVSGGGDFSGDVIVEFRALPITLSVLRDAETTFKGAASLVERSGPDVDVRELTKAIDVNSIHFERGRVEVSEALETVGWVSDLQNLKLDETVALYIFVSNDSGETLHDARLIATSVC